MLKRVEERRIKDRERERHHKLLEKKRLELALAQERQSVVDRTERRELLAFFASAMTYFVFVYWS